MGDGMVTMCWDRLDAYSTVSSDLVNEARAEVGILKGGDRGIFIL